MDNYFKFPTGEAHVKIDRAGRNQLFVPMQDNLNDYIMMVLLAADVFKKSGSYKVEGNFKGANRFSTTIINSPFDVLLPYLPYSRQDRPTSSREPFSLKVLGDLLRTTGCSRVITLDVHSDVAYGCIDNLVNIDVGSIWVDFFAKDVKSGKSLVIPDQGAFKKLNKYSDHFSGTILGIKERNPANGHLTLSNLIGDIKGKDCLIIDDICDGGGTFILLAKELLGRGAKTVELAVTHGVFSKGVDCLFDSGISKIYTTDSFAQTDKVQVRSVEEILRSIL